ncbi:MAG: DUF1963 domain-containing protein [Clostridiales bacterium]|nr:DUF1963 domain-containing protein [Clostridiales bacterium]
MAARDPALVRLLTDTLRPFVRNEIRVIPGEEVDTLPVGVSKIGGLPDVPADFVWPTYEEDGHSLPLCFLAQIDCRIASAADREGLLPQEGLLSFFYELDTMKWGFDPADRGSARVYWFPDLTSLCRTPPPPEFGWPDWMEGPLPCLPLTFEPRPSVPCYEDFCETEEERRILPQFPSGHFWEYYDEAARSLGWDEESAEAERSKLLGWPDILNNPMFVDCEAVTGGFYIGDDGWMDRLTYEEKVTMHRRALEDWILLFQLGTLRAGDRAIYWGDAGHLFFWIRREDLARRDFSKIWMIMQCD